MKKITNPKAIHICNLHKLTHKPNSAKELFFSDANMKVDK